jgi:hypothetical protein
VIICSVHSKTASKILGTSGAMASLSFEMMAANRLNTSASLHQGVQGSQPASTCAVLTRKERSDRADGKGKSAWKRTLEEPNGVREQARDGRERVHLASATLRA